MEPILLIVAMLALVFSFYRLFVSNNAMSLGVSLMRASLAILAVIAARFTSQVVLVTSVLLFVLISILVLALVRSEVQIKHD
jgi:hypothetical protein